MYKAKCNISCGMDFFERGELYTSKQIAGQDINDFELIEEVEVKPQSMTTEDFKPKRTRKTKN